MTLVQPAFEIPSTVAALTAGQTSYASHPASVAGGAYAPGSYDAAECAVRCVQIYKAHSPGVAQDEDVRVGILPTTLFPYVLHAVGVEGSSVTGGSLYPWSTATEYLVRIDHSPAFWQRVPSSAATDQHARLEALQGVQTVWHAEVARWVAELDARIDGFTKGRGARVGVATAERARGVLRQFPSDLAAPQVVPSVDGDVLFVWYDRGDHVEVNIDPDGHTTWFGKFAGVYEPGEDVDGHAVLPPCLEEMLRRLHG